MSSEIPVRFAPPLSDSDRFTKPFMECGAKVRLAGKLVACVRSKGHPVRINFGHSNGYDEWCFDAEASATDE